jgi:hypothetical protein
LSPIGFGGIFLAMRKTEVLEALPKLSPEERREIRGKLNEIDGQEWQQSY